MGFLNGKKVATILQRVASKDVYDNLSNPNLLINGDFRVNQRGQTSYTTTKKYTVDRWQLSYGTLAVNSDGSVTHTASNTWQGILQYIEFPSRLAGKTVTVSVYASATKTKLAQMSVVRAGSSTATNIGSTNTVTGTGINSFTATIPSDITDNDKLYVLLYTPEANQSVTYYWAKLEIGSVATANSPRPYAEELAMCQRYYQVVKSITAYGSIGMGYTNAQTTAQINVPINTSMRTIPSMTYSGTFRLIVNGNGHGVSKIEIAQYSSCYYRLLVTAISNMTTQAFGILQGENDANAYIGFDAEIY